ncbi:hypothetical protein PROFUN_03168 [Planoprotostelium fungivorum]|uniref:Uncharacterized protein n=1 Tax=Planoprotostelium fungivorum TaxID=1890364 RepID=A0A2P6NWX0_9EUKA|nr:hypothetical protein PROFUN_03168 [Planoprotostelium fungivorum]
MMESTSIDLISSTKSDGDSVGFDANASRDELRRAREDGDLTGKTRSLTKEGYLTKKGEKGILLWWTKREHPGSEAAKGVIQLDEFTSVKRTQGSDRGFEISNQYKSRIYQLQAETPEEMNDWITAVDECINMMSKTSRGGSLRSSSAEFINHPGNLTVDVTSCFYLLTGTGNHTEYMIKVRYIKPDGTVVQSYTVCRRYKHTLSLHEMLVKLNPGIQFPNFPSRLIFRSKEGRAEERREGLNTYFHSLLTNKNITKMKQIHSFFSPDKERRLLSVTVSSGRHLDKAPMYCQLTLQNDKRKNMTVSCRTHVAPADDHHKWSATYHFEVTEDSSLLSVELYMDNSISIQRKGYVEVPLHTIPPRQKTQHWFPLHETKGEIKLRFLHQLYDSGNSIEPEYRISDIRESTELSKSAEGLKISKPKKAISTSGDGAMKMKIRYFYNPPYVQWEGSLYIELVEANKLVRGTESFVILRLDSLEHRTPLVKPSSQSHFAFWFHVSPETCGQLSIQVYELKRNETSLVVGWVKIDLSQLKEQKAVEAMFPVQVRQETPAEQYIPKQLGKVFAQKGYTPSLPVIVIPGFASTGLEVLQGEPEWLKQRVWFNFSKLSSEHMRRMNLMTFGKLRGFLSKEKEPQPLPPNTIPPSNNVDSALGLTDPADEDEGLTQEEQIFRNRWVAYMRLNHDDGYSDPPNIMVRPINGKEGIDYLDSESVLANATYVMGPLFDMLEDLGYEHHQNLLAAPYDWRIPPHIMEERDRYLSRLAVDIRMLYENTGKPVVVIAHSMGNKVFHYFCNWASRQPSLGIEWLQKHIHTFMAIGAPWIGSPKMIRGAASGENMGLRHLLPFKESKEFIRSFGVVPFLFPMQPPHEPSPKVPLAFLRNEYSNGGYTPMGSEELLKKSGAEQMSKWLDEYFMADPCFGKDLAVLEPPPGLKRLFCVYGVDVPTETNYFYRTHPTKALVIDENAPTGSVEGHTTIKGIVYETEDTPQERIKKEQPGRSPNRSGDGSVPYHSLSYCNNWKDKLELECRELKNVEHRAILSSRILFFLITNLVSEKPKNAMDFQWTGTGSF